MVAKLIFSTCVMHLFYYIIILFALIFQWIILWFTSCDSRASYVFILLKVIKINSIFDQSSSTAFFYMGDNPHTHNGVLINSDRIVYKPIHLIS